MTLSEIAFRNSLYEDLNVESWMEITPNFKSESSLELSLSNLKKDNIKADKKNILSNVNQGKRLKNKKVVNRKLSNNHKKNADTLSNGRTSLILKKS